jgi:hypothetical protein
MKSKSTTTIKKAWQTPEVMIISKVNINGGGPLTSFYEGASGHIIAKTSQHNDFTVGAASKNFVS